MVTKTSISQLLQCTKYGVRIKSIIYAPFQLKIINYKRNNATNQWYHVELHEGKNREIRNIFQFCNITVNRLIRTEYGPFKLGNLKLGDMNEIRVPNQFKF